MPNPDDPDINDPDIPWKPLPGPSPIDVIMADDPEWKRRKRQQGAPQPTGSVRERSGRYLHSQLDELFAMTSDDTLSAAEKLKAFELIAKIGDVFKAPEQQAKVEVVVLSREAIDDAPAARYGESPTSSPKGSSK